MRRKTTPGHMVVLALLAMVASACSDSDPDPRVIAAAIDAERQTRPDWQQPVPEVSAPGGADSNASPPPPVPTAETQVREDVPELPKTIIALGVDAAHVVDPTVRRAIAQACPELAAKYAPCSDRDAVEVLMVGRADFGVIGGPLSPREVDAGLGQTRIGIELFALAVDQDLAARSLSRAQVRQVLTGEVTRWEQLGLEGGDITIFAPADRHVAQRAARALMPGDNFPATARRVDSAREMASNILVVSGAIGIVHVLDQPLAAGLKLLQIDWIDATAESFAGDTYPFGQAVHLVTSGPPTGASLRFLEYARSDAGRSLLQRTLLVR
ncbi:MAG TPA: substrate-binding domain-containing protein [Planctomycetota bacterium]|nr:substrate-binding domain-containing protein [Planctomycetota bacterium]